MCIRDRNKITAAEQYFIEGKQLREHWVNTGYYAVAKVKEATIQARIGNKELAIQKIDQAITWLKQTNFTKRLGYALWGKIHIYEGNEEQLCTLVEEANYVLSKKAVDLDNNYSILLDKLGDCLVGKGNTAVADSLYLQSLSITEKLFGKKVGSML